MASSKSKVCPICGEAIAAETQEAQPTIADSAAEKKPQTLNDIIAERNAQRTLHDTMTENETAKEEATIPTVVPTPPTTTINTTNEPVDGGNYDDGGWSDNERDDYEAEIKRHKATASGFMIAAIVLLILLIPAAYLSINWGLKAKTIKENYALVESARRLFEDENAMLQRNAEDLVTELESLKDKNDTMMIKYQEAVVMLEQLQKEKTYNYNELARYKKEVATLRSVMHGYLRQIDSLNTINSNLQKQNVAYKKEISTANLRADVAEEKASEAETKVRIGAVIRSSGIRMVALNDKSKEVKRIKYASRLRVDFELTANELAEPGEKSIYICITGPDGYPMISDGVAFNFEGDVMPATAMRKVDYENQSVPVSIFYDGSGFIKGAYTVDIYIDGRHSGSQETYFE